MIIGQIHYMHWEKYPKILIMYISMKLDRYRHYKWSLCEVIGIARDSETLEDMVVYKHYDAVKWEKEMSLRVRPLKMFQENVIVDGKEVERFAYIGEDEA